jgi:small-conductance mechanosensitive channel
VFERFFSNPESIPPSAVVLAALFLVGLAVRSVSFRLLHRWAQRTESTVDDLILGATRGPSLLWIVALSLHVAVGTSKLPEAVIEYASRALGVIVILSVTLTLANIAALLFRAYASKMELAVTGLAESVLRLAIVAIGLVMGLEMLGVNITPLVTALGIGGLAVALGLQDTLANVFAGIHILLSKPIRVGDYVKLESGEEGYVVDVTWRSTRIRMLANNLIIVPNSKLSQTIIVNYHLPDPELAVLVQVGVHYESDLVRAEQVTREVGKEVMQAVTGGVPEFEPFVRYHTFADSSIGFTVILRARQFVDQFLVKHEFVKRLQARYAKEGIVIPFPIRTLDLPPDTWERLRGAVSN